MADLDPIRQLQHLLDDPGRVLEKISRIQSALGAIKAPDPAPSSETPPAIVRADELKPILKNEDHPFDRLLQTVRDMQAQIEERLRPLARQTVQAEVEYLRRQAEQDQSALNECWARIDRSITISVERIDESRQKYAELKRLNHRLIELGAAAEALPEDSYSQTPSEIIYSRLENLRREGKI
ncbi:MAG: hypothetical protein ACREQ2_26320 [Candidatus Binatia bacterium]